MKDLIHAFSCSFISSYECTWKVWRALKKPELLLAVPRATLAFLLYPPNFSHAFKIRYTHPKASRSDKPIPKLLPASM